MTKRLLLQLTLGGGLLVPALALAQEKPSLNTGLPAPAPAPVTPAPAPVTPEPAQPAPAPPAAAPPALPPPTYGSPSGFELPQREQERKAAQQHADQFTKFFIYSGVGLGYSSFNGNGVFNASLSPALGYRLNDRIAVGPGISYAYANYAIGGGYPNISTNSWGVKAFAQVIVYKEFFVHGEYEVTNAQFPDDGTGRLVYNTLTKQFETSTQQVRSPLAGIGYRSQFSERAAADFLVLYNFNDTFNNRLYTNPVIRFNFLFNIGH